MNPEDPNQLPPEAIAAIEAEPSLDVSYADCVRFLKLHDPTRRLPRKPNRREKIALIQHASAVYRRLSRHVTASRQAIAAKAVRDEERKKHRLDANDSVSAETMEKARELLQSVAE